MAITTYAELQTAVTDWMTRSNLSGRAADFIALAEARLNREIPAVETDETLTGTATSRRISISALSMVEPIALFLAKSGQDEREIQQKPDGSFPYLNTEGEPSFYAIDGENIDFDRPLDEAYPFRFRYRQKFALSDSATTNWLLTNHPDVYLAATLVWGGVFIRNPQYSAIFAGSLDNGIADVCNQIAQKNRGVLTVDRALLSPGRFDFNTGLVV
jgi:hypothetical protein